MNIDQAGTREILALINQEDKTVAFAVERELDHIAALVDDVVAAFRRGGRLFYVGAGTSGRLGVLDASECPPTYGVPPTMVQGVIAGGRRGLVRSIEGAEDDSEGGVRDLQAAGFGPVTCWWHHRVRPGPLRPGRNGVGPRERRRGGRD